MLFIFIEGPDDERFFSKVFATYFKEARFVQYSGLTTSKVNQFINSIKYNQESEYLFFTDADGKTIQEKRKAAINKFSALDEKRVFIVQFEIESWYYSGVDASFCREYKLEHYVSRTDSFTKEDFEKRLPNHSERIYIMTQILSSFSIPLATQRNNSFSIFNEYIKNKEPI